MTKQSEASSSHSSDSSDRLSMRDSRRRTSSENSSTSVSDSSSPPTMGRQADWTRGPEQMWVKWIHPNATAAKKFADELRDTLRGAHKMRFSTMALAGMVVQYEVLHSGCRTWLVFWAEPEAELPF